MGLLREVLPLFLKNQLWNLHGFSPSISAFQGPLKRLKVYLELQKLKNLWDAKFDKQEFEIGTKHVGNNLNVKNSFLTLVYLFPSNRSDQLQFKGFSCQLEQSNCKALLNFCPIIATQISKSSKFFLQALCSVTRIIKDRAFDNLRGLLTVRERKKLEEDVSTKWTQVEK